MNDKAATAALLPLTTPLPVWHESRLSARTDSLVAVSRGAALIRSARPLPAGTPVYLELEVGAAIDAIAATSDEEGFVVDFLTVDDRARLLIESWLKSGDPPGAGLVEQPAIALQRIDTPTAPAVRRPGDTVDDGFGQLAVTLSHPAEVPFALATDPFAGLPVVVAPVDVAPEVALVDVAPVDVAPVDVAVEVALVDVAAPDVAPVDVAPVEVAPVDVAPVEVAPVEDVVVEVATVEVAPVEDVVVEVATVAVAPVEDVVVEVATVAVAPVDDVVVEVAVDGVPDVAEPAAHVDVAAPVVAVESVAVAPDEAPVQRTRTDELFGVAERAPRLTPAPTRPSRTKTAPLMPAFSLNDAPLPDVPPTPSFGTSSAGVPLVATPVPQAGVGEAVSPGTTQELVIQRGDLELPPAPPPSLSRALAANLPLDEVPAVESTQRWPPAVARRPNDDFDTTQRWPASVARASEPEAAPIALPAPVREETTATATTTPPPSALSSTPTPPAFDAPPESPWAHEAESPRSAEATRPWPVARARALEEEPVALPSSTSTNHEPEVAPEAEPATSMLVLSEVAAGSDDATMAAVAAGAFEINFDEAFAGDAPPPPASTPATSWAAPSTPPLAEAPPRPLGLQALHAAPAPDEDAGFDVEFTAPRKAAPRDQPRPLPAPDDDGVVDVDFSEFKDVIGVGVAFRSEGPPPPAVAVSDVAPTPRPLPRPPALPLQPTTTTTTTSNPFGGDSHAPGSTPPASESTPPTPPPKPTADDWQVTSLATAQPRTATPTPLPAPRLLDHGFDAVLARVGSGPIPIPPAPAPAPAPAAAPAPATPAPTASAFAEAPPTGSVDVDLDDLPVVGGSLDDVEVSDVDLDDLPVVEGSVAAAPSTPPTLAPEQWSIGPPAFVAFPPIAKKE